MELMGHPAEDSKQQSVFPRKIQTVMKKKTCLLNAEIQFSVMDVSFFKQF